MDLGLAGRVAVVTGASRGIGRAVAERLGAGGCRLVLCARGQDALEDTASRLESSGAEVATVAVDLTDPDGPERVASTAVGRFGGVDVLVNNAGGASARRLDTVTADEWRDGFELNFFAAARMAAACLPSMRSRGWGRIVNIASTYGVEPDPWFGPYSAAKAALINLSKNLSLAFSSEGVLTNCVIPGVTLTELVEENAAEAARSSGSSPEAVMDRMMSRHPVAAGRFGDPDEVAAAVAFLASEQAGWITGACLAVDGGTLRSAR